jgi:serine/threonine-protein kinase RsbW
LWKAANSAGRVSRNQPGCRQEKRATGFDKLDVTLHNRISEIPLAHTSLDQFAGEHGLPSRDVAPLHVALEEHLTNIVRHGFSPGQTGSIRLQFTIESSTLRIQVEDDARPFNPLEAPEVDTSLPLEAKPLGGLGLHMIRKNMDHLDYLRRDNWNVLTMSKRL